MAKLQPMRYKDYVWPHNPYSYSISYRRHVAEQKVPYGFYTLQDLGQSCRVMQGRGEFAGPGAYEEFKKLATVYYSPGSGILVHPCWQAARVYFVKLSLTEVPRPDYVAYAFEFLEDCEKHEIRLKEAVPPGKTGGGTAAQPGLPGGKQRFHTVCRGENLWGIARKYGLTLHALLSMNHEIKNPNLIYAGQKVRVA